MKKINYILCLIIMIFIGTNNVFATSIEIRSTTKNITKGNSLSISVVITNDKDNDGSLVNIEGKLTCSGAGVSKSYDLSFDDSSNSVFSKTFSYSVTPTTNGTLVCNTSGVRITKMKSSGWNNLGNKEVKITVNNPQTTPTKVLSSNNYLSSLSIDGLELNEEFQKDLLEYSVTVPAETEKIKINAQLADSNARVTGTGEVSLVEGINDLEIIVIAENGSKKTYKLKATVQEPTPIEAIVNGNTYTVVRKRKDLPKISEYFSEKDFQISENNIEGYYNEKLDYNIVGLKDKEGKISLYKYSKNNYYPYNEYTFNGTTVEIIDREINSQYIKTEIAYADSKIPCYQEMKRDLIKNTYALDENSVIENNEFYLFYAKNIETGKENLYQYDSVEKTIQRYNIKLLDIYKNQNDTYYFYLLISILAIGLLIIFFNLILIIKGKKVKRKYRLIRDDEEQAILDDPNPNEKIKITESNDIPLEDLTKKQNVSKKKHKKSKNSRN